MKRRPIYFLFVFLFGATGVEGQNLFERKEITLTEQWDLDDKESNSRGLFAIKTYKPVYVLLGKFSSNVNSLPHSANPDRNPVEPVPLNKSEQEFQLSMKTKVFNNLLGDKLGGDIWVAYTQVSYWQVFNTDLSRPFRETNYEPEFMFILPVNYRLLGLDGVFMGIGFNHQSNGRSNPYSRSWNRIIAQFAMETKNMTVMFRPWLRLSEDFEEDDNPGITDYVGRGELLFAYGKGRHDLSVLGRHSMRLGDHNKGSIKIDYSIRIIDNLRFHAHFFSGYGESLIDFNHRQSVIGFGVSVVEWR